MPIKVEVHVTLQCSSAGRWEELNPMQPRGDLGTLHSVGPALPCRVSVFLGACASGQQTENHGLFSGPGWKPPSSLTATFHWPEFSHMNPPTCQLGVHLCVSEKEDTRFGNCTPLSLSHVPRTVRGHPRSVLGDGGQQGLGTHTLSARLSAHSEEGASPRPDRLLPTQLLVR